MKKAKIWVKKTSSFQEADKQNFEYYLSMTPQERLETVQFLRDQHYKLMANHENRKRLRKIVRIVKQT
jgi:hypothetical protein